MEEKQEALIKAVKFAVTKYGIAGISTRNVGDWFESQIFKTLLREIDKAHELPHRRGMQICNVFDMHYPVRFGLLGGERKGAGYR